MEQNNLSKIKDLYESLSPSEKINFARYYQQSLKQDNDSRQEMREEIAKAFINMKDNKGEPYFEEKYIRNLLS